MGNIIILIRKVVDKHILKKEATIENKKILTKKIIINLLIYIFKYVIYIVVLLLLTNNCRSWEY